MAKEEKKNENEKGSAASALLDASVAFRRPEVGERVQFILNDGKPQAAVVVAAYAEKHPQKAGEMVEYVNIRCFEARRTSETPYYQRIKFGTEPGCWRFIPSASKDV